MGVGRDRLAVAAVALVVLVPQVLPIERLPATGIDDSLGHALLFALLAAGVAWSMRHRSWQARTRAVLVVGLVVGVLGEGLQALVPDRQASAHDLFVDWAVTLAAAVATVHLPGDAGRLSGRSAASPGASRRGS